MIEHEEGWDTFDSDDDTFACPICGKTDVILPAGPKHSPILLVTGEPTPTELGEGIPFVGQFAGVLRSEMGLFDLDMRSMRRMTMLQHSPVTGKGNRQKECTAHGVRKVIEEAYGRKIVVLFGSDTVKALCGMNVSEVSGLRVTSPLMPSLIVLPCVSIGSVFKSGVGEIRFALRELSILVKELDLNPSNEAKKGKKSSRPEPIDEEEDW